MPEDQKPLTLEDWAGTQNLALTLVFTDIVDSTRIGIELADTTWIGNLMEHFSTARIIALMYDCYVVKVIGDSLMLAFRTSSEAVQFATSFSLDTGFDYIGIRVGIHSGEVEIRDNDIYGLNVNFAARVQHALPGEGILSTESVKRDYERRLGSNTGVQFVPREVDLRSFGKETVYFTFKPEFRMVSRLHSNARELKWFQPVRELLGGFLLRNNDYAEAEKVFRADLEKNKHNGRSLFGLMESLKAQKKADAAATVQREFDNAWKNADTKLAVQSLWP